MTRAPQFGMQSPLDIQKKVWMSNTKVNNIGKIRLRGHTPMASRLMVYCPYRPMGRAHECQKSALSLLLDVRNVDALGLKLAIFSLIEHHSNKLKSCVRPPRALFRLSSTDCRCRPSRRTDHHTSCHDCDHRVFVSCSVSYSQSGVAFLLPRTAQHINPHHPMHSRPRGTGEDGVGDAVSID